MTNSFREGTLRPVIVSFFNDDFAASRSFLDGYIASRPDDALAHALAAAVQFYPNLTKRMLTGEDLSEIRWTEAGIDGREVIASSLARAERLAEQAINDRDASDLAIFALSLATSVRRDYCGVLGRWKDALKYAREANLLCRELLKANPDAHDAYFVFGCSEYLVSRIPKVWRPFAKIPGITGERTKAISFCEVTARSGRYYRELAMGLLVALHTDLGNEPSAIRILSKLAGEFPANSVVATELSRRMGVESKSVRG